MIRKRGGDGYPPDTNAEKKSPPKVGEIYKRVEPGGREDFIQIRKVTDPDQAGRIHIDFLTWKNNKKKWEKRARLSGRVLLKNFNTQDPNDPAYVKYADNERDFYKMENIPPQDQPITPFSISEHVSESDLNPKEEAEREKETEGAPETPTEDKEEELAQEPKEDIPREATEESESETPEEEENATQREEGNAIQEYSYADYEKQKEILEEILAAARLKFVQDDYEYTTQTNKLTRFFRLTSGAIPPRESLSAVEYGEALKNLRDYEFNHLQGTLDALSPNLRKEKIESFLLRYRYQEAIELHSLGKEVQTLAEDETLAGKIKLQIKELGNGYRKLSFKKKMAITAGVIGIGALSGAVASVAGVASVAYVTKRVVAGAASYLATDEGINTFLSKRAKKKAKSESEEMASSMVKNEFLHRAEENAQERETEAWEQLLAATNEKLKDLNKDLEKLKTRESRIKIAAFAAAIGLPAIAQVLGIFEGSGSIDKSALHETTGTENIQPESQFIETPPEATVAPSTVEVIVPEEPLASPDIAEVRESIEEKVAREIKEAQTIVEVPTPELEPGQGHPDVIGFKDTPLSSEEQYWIDIRNKQGLFTDADEVHPEGDEFNSISIGNETISSNIITDNATISSEAVEQASIVSPDVAQDVNLAAEVVESNPELAVSSVETPDTMEPEMEAVSEAGESSSSTETAEAQSAPQDLLKENGAFNPETNHSYSYSYEDSRFEKLPVEQRPLWRENMILLQEELVDINSSEFGPNYTPSNWQTDQLWALHKEKSMQDIIAFDNPRYNYDPRDYYRDWQAQQIGRRGIYLPPMHPEPQLTSGPDAYAIHTMDTIKDEYRHNLSEMQRTALAKFGTAAYPIGRAENVQQYMTRIATLYTKARIENPNFRLKF